MPAAPSRSGRPSKSTQSPPRPSSPASSGPPPPCRAACVGPPPRNLMRARLNGRGVLLGVRPEHLEPCSESEADFVAVVDLVEPLGADTLAHGTVEGTRIVVRLTGAQRLRAGRTPLRFDPAQRHYFDAASGARIESV